MLKLLRRSKHEEFKSNSTLQIKDQKEKKAKCKEKWSTAGVLLPLVVFATIFGFSPFYPCCNHLCFDCMVFHLVCKAI